MTNDLAPLERFMAREEPSPPDAARARVRARLLDHIDRASAAPAPVRSRRVRMSVALLGPVGVAAAVIGLTLAVDEQRVTPAGAAARTLERAATAAAATPSDVPPPGRFLRLRVRERALITDPTGGWRRTASVESELWIARDGRTRVKERTVGAPRFLTPGDRRRWIAAGRPPLVTPRRPPVAVTAPGYTLGQERLSYRQVRALPTRGAALYRRLRRAAGSLGQSPEAETFVIIGDLLRSAPLSSRLTAALYRAAAQIPGVRLAGRVRDPLGRPAVAVELAVGDRRFQLIFNPQTSEYLGDRAYEGGLLTDWRVVESRDIVPGPRSP